MKTTLTFLIMLNIIFQSMLAQQDVGILRNKYSIDPDKASQDTIFFTRKTKSVTIKKGTNITESKNGIEIHRTLTKDSIYLINEDVPMKFNQTWYAGEVKHTNEAPDKLYLNPWTFTDLKDSLLNAKCYIKIPNNSYVMLRKTYFKMSAITIPFALRPALNDTIGSKITSDVKAGVSLSYNLSWEKFKNRRIEAKQSLYGLSFGVAGGFSKVTLDASSTNLNVEPLKYAEDGLSFFLAPGIALNVKGVQAGFYIGYDFGITDNVSKWNYNKKMYYGLGLGIGLDIFGKL